MGSGYAVGPLAMGSLLDQSGFQFSWMTAASVVLFSTIAMKMIDISQTRNKQKRILNSQNIQTRQ